MNIPDKYKVLIVNDNAETGESIQRILGTDNRIKVIGSAHNGKESIDVAIKFKPEVIIIDIDLPDIDGIDAADVIRRNLPYVQTIILSERNDISTIRKAMLIGARDFLTKPLNDAEFLSAIHKAGDSAREEAIRIYNGINKEGSPNNVDGVKGKSGGGKIISVYSPKGGSGATTIATNLAIALKSNNKSVVLVDGNMQYGDVAVFLNEQVKNSIIDLAPRVDELEPEIIQDVIITHSRSGLSIIASPTRLELSDSVTGEQFGKFLRILRNIFDFVVIDTPSYLSETALVSVDVSDLIILISTQDIPTIKNVHTFLNLTDASDINRDQILFILNKYEKRSGITPDQISKNLKQEISYLIPLDEERSIINSINKGIPIILDKKDHPVSKGITNLAGKIFDHFNKK